MSGRKKVGWVLYVFTVLLLLTSFGAMLKDPTVHAYEVIYINADGSISQSTASITTIDNVTYAFAGNIHGSIVVQRNGITVDGNGYSLQGLGNEGFLLSGVNNVTIRNATITNFDHGIWLDDSSGCILSDNSLAYNLYGIFLKHFCNNNTLSGNDVTNNNYGFWLQWECNNNTLYDNNITHNGYGVFLDSSSNNRIFHNNFLNRGVEAVQVSDWNNTWDDGYPSGGNYWNDYGSTYPNAAEIDNSSIWNTPYVIWAPDSQDNYPLVFPFHQRHGPIASFSCNQTTAKVDQLLVFDASKSLHGWNGTHSMSITEYRWDFGDGNATSTNQPTILHSYSYYNIFNITLTVTDSQGLNQSYSVTVTVLPMPTYLSVTTCSTSGVLDYRVDIYGTLSDAYGKGLADELVTLRYTFPSITLSSAWYQIGSTYTDAHGQYLFQWTPQAFYYAIEAEWAGNATHTASDSNVTLSALPYWNMGVFSVESNSTVSELSWDSAVQTLSFFTSGESGTTGYAKVTMPKTLVSNVEGAKVYLYGSQTEYSATSQNDTWILTFTYRLGSYGVAVNIEFAITNGVSPNLTKWICVTVAAVVAALTGGIVVMKRKKQLRKQEPRAVNMKSWLKKVRISLVVITLLLWITTIILNYFKYRAQQPIPGRFCYCLSESFGSMLAQCPLYWCSIVLTVAVVMFEGVLLVRNKQKVGGFLVESLIVIIPCVITIVLMILLAGAH